MASIADMLRNACLRHPAVSKIPTVATRYLATSLS